MTTWYELLKEAFEQTGDDFTKMDSTLLEEELHREFGDIDLDYYPQGSPFTAWGERYVYFPVLHDLCEWVGYAPRNVSDIITLHQGR